MRRVKLGWRGPEVSEVCFGTLAVSPLQGRVTLEEGIEVIRYAVSRGIDWLDTAEIYGNYEQLRPVLKEYPHLKIVTKSYAVSAEDMTRSLEKARKIFDRDVIDFFLLHEQESGLTLKGHIKAWEMLLEAKEKGIVGYTGISTHAVRGVRDGALHPGVDVIHPIINYNGLGIIDGTLAEMLDAVSFAAELGIGIYAMKVFGGGHLTNDPDRALEFVRGVKGVQAMALGMSSILEIDYNLRILEGEVVPEELRKAVLGRQRQLFIADWCEGCGMCVGVCPQKALFIKKGRVSVNRETCILCGYCGRVCPHFCLKIV